MSCREPGVAVRQALAGLRRAVFWDLCVWNLSICLTFLHRYVPDPSAPAAAALVPAQIAAVKTVVRKIRGLPLDTYVTISDLACANAGCPLIETVIVVFPDDRPALRRRLTRPRAALTKLMLRQALTTPPETSGSARGLDALVTLSS